MTPQTEEKCNRMMRACLKAFFFQIESHPFIAYATGITDSLNLLKSTGAIEYTEKEKYFSQNHPNHPAPY
jgi:hypothetical protein